MKTAMLTRMAEISFCVGSRRCSCVGSCVGVGVGKSKGVLEGVLEEGHEVPCRDVCREIEVGSLVTTVGCTHCFRR